MLTPLDTHTTTPATNMTRFVRTSVLFAMTVSLTLIVLTSTSSSTTTTFRHEQHDRYRAAAIALLEQLGIDAARLFGEDADHKRDLKADWAKLLQRSPPPYTIAFPALLRSRRAATKRQGAELL